jgi:hypothetical protein
MKDLSLNASAFPTAHCAACGRVVLVHVALDEGDRERRCCVRCDAEIAEPVRWVKAGELEREGYYFGPPPAKGANGANGSTGGGCGSGCGTCGTRGH